MATKQKNENLSVEEIRPEAVMAGQRRAVTADVRRLLKDKNKFISVACPACSGKKSVYKYEKRGFRYVDCSTCGTMYMNPRPSMKVLEDFYRYSKNYAYWSSHIFPVSERARREKIFVPRVQRVLELCKKYGVKSKSLLEVGAGFGTFCVELSKRKIFKDVVAVEPTPDLAEMCRSRGVTVIEEPIEHIRFPEGKEFGVIVNFEVIEHILSPYDFLTSCNRLLSPGGLLLLTCPNGKGFDVETLGTKSDTVDHEHLNYFNPTSIRVLFERCGFDVLEVSTPGKLDADLVRAKVLNGTYSLKDQPFLKRVLIDEWDTLGERFQNFLVANDLSSNMWVVATKPGTKVKR